MKKEIIETRDKKFCDKLSELRRDLAKRQKLAAQNKGNLRNQFKIVAPVFIILVAAYFSVGKTTPSRQPASTVIPDIRQTEEKTIEEKTNTVSPGPPESAATLAETEKSRDNSRDVAMAEPQSEKSPPSETERETDGPNFEMEIATNSGIDSQAAPIENRTPENSSSTDDSSVKGPDSSENSNAEPVESEAAEETNQATSPLASVDSPSAYGAKIARKSVCSGVRDRECVAPLSRFSLDKQTRPYFWMEVNSGSVPYVLKHVYYHEGRKYTEIPLEIRHPRMRTWSKITLNSPEQTGTWRVQIETEDGVVLGSDEFQFVAGR